MSSSDDFKAALSAGNIGQALTIALGEAVEIRITTWVSETPPPGSERSEEFNTPRPGSRMHTRINIVEGDIENEIGREFLDGAYQELRSFHEEQAERGFDIIHENLRTIQDLFKVLMHCRQGVLSGAPDAEMEQIGVNLDETVVSSECPDEPDEPVDEHLQAIAPDPSLGDTEDSLWGGDPEWSSAIEDEPTENGPTNTPMTADTIAPDERCFEAIAASGENPDRIDESSYTETAAAIAADASPEPSAESSNETHVAVPDELTQQLQTATAQTQQEPNTAIDVSEELHLLELDLLNVETGTDLELMVEPGNLATNLRSLAETTPLNPGPAANRVDVRESAAEAIASSTAAGNYIEDVKAVENNLSAAESTDEPDAIADDILADLPDLSNEYPSEAIEMSERELSHLFAGSRDLDNMETGWDDAEFEAESDDDTDEFSSTEVTADALHDFAVFLEEDEPMAERSASSSPADAIDTDPTRTTYSRTEDNQSDVEELLFSEALAADAHLTDPDDPFQAIAPETSDPTPADDPLGLFSDSDAINAIDTESLSQPEGTHPNQDDPLEFMSEGLAGDVATLEELSRSASSAENYPAQESPEESLEESLEKLESRSVDDDDLLDLAELLMENMPNASPDRRDRPFSPIDVPDPWEDLN